MNTQKPLWDSTCEDIANRLDGSSRNYIVDRFESLNMEDQLRMFRAYSILYERGYLNSFHDYIKQEIPTDEEIAQMEHDGREDEAELNRMYFEAHKTA